MRASRNRYPNPGMQVLWVWIDADPGAFFSLTYLPPNIHLKDPSKMKEHEINKCLKLWLKVEREGERCGSVACLIRAAPLLPYGD